MDVFEEAFARLRRRNSGVVKIDILALAVVRSNANHVALVRHDINELELPVEATNGGVGLANLLARLDREADRRCVGELEADDGMRHPRRSPVNDGKVDAGDLRAAHGTRFPMWYIVGLSPVVADANVVERDLVALNSGCRILRHI